MYASGLRRHILLAGAGLLGLSTSQAAPVTLPSPASLQEALARALEKRSPLVVLVSLEGCPFCKTARENYLAPLQTQQNLPVVQLDMRSRQVVQNFKGVQTTHDELIRSWGVKIAPTVLFFGRDGQELAERLVGAYIPDFYGSYLDERLKLARLTIF